MKCWLWTDLAARNQRSGATVNSRAPPVCSPSRLKSQTRTEATRSHQILGVSGTAMMPYSEGHRSRSPVVKVRGGPGGSARPPAPI